VRPRRIDANQPEAVNHLRGAGYGVWITSPLGGGFPDLVVAHNVDRWFTALVEIKDGKKPPSGRRLTLPEQAFKNRWPGICITALSGEDALTQLEEARVHATRKAQR
jgi:hypothetical protein